MAPDAIGLELVPNRCVITHGSAYDRSEAAWHQAQHARLHNRVKVWSDLFVPAV
jgi:hypothetical protein